MSKPEPPKMPDPIDVLIAIGLVGAAALMLCLMGFMAIDVVAYGMEKLS